LYWLRTVGIAWDRIGVIGSRLVPICLEEFSPARERVGVAARFTQYET